MQQVTAGPGTCHRPPAPGLRYRRRMGWRAALLPALVAAACYGPEPAAGGPCSSRFECPFGQVCDRTALAGPTCNAAPSGDVPLPNDQPPGAIDVSAGGRFVFDASGAADDADASCGAGGPDVFFRFELDGPEVVYLDTIGSAGDPAIAVLAGDCASRGDVEACADHTCGAHAQGAWHLPAGTHCIVVEGATGPGQLQVVRGGHDGEPLPARAGTVTGNTCNDDDNNNAGCGCEPARDHHYFFTLCPGATATAHLETCTGATWDTVLQLRDGTYAGIACTDNDSCQAAQETLTRAVTGPGLFWAIIDGCADCGPYTLSYSY